MKMHGMGTHRTLLSPKLSRGKNRLSCVDVYVTQEKAHAKRAVHMHPCVLCR